MKDFPHTDLSWDGKRFGRIDNLTTKGLQQMKVTSATTKENVDFIKSCKYGHKICSPGLAPCEHLSTSLVNFRCDFSRCLFSSRVFIGAS